MNTVNIVGRLTRDPSGRTVNSAAKGELRVVSFTVAVNRRTKGEADFISCQAWGKKAENIERYTHKGDRISITGRIQTGSYTDKEGRTVYTTDVMVEDFDFLEPKKGIDERDPVDDFQPADDEGLPFA